MSTVFTRSQRGSGMVMGFFVMTLVFAFSISLVTLTWNSLGASKRDVLRTRALACAEAGIDKYISLLMSGDGTFREPQTFDLSSDGSERTSVTPSDGSGITAGKIILTSVGTVTQFGRTSTRTIKAVLNLSRENVSVWNNAIFGGVGQAGNSINGNVAIRGSVHLLGDGEEFTDLDSDTRWDDNETYTDSNHNGQYDLGETYTDSDGDHHRDAREPFCDANGNGTRDPALTVTDLAEEISGTANIGNNYDGMPVDLRNVVPDPPQVAYGGETVDSLSAKLRVKHGRVNISGSATVGDANQAGNSLKETLDGTYVSDGFGGNRGTASVNADNGYAHGYDLGEDVVKMPLIDFGAYTKDGTTYANYLAYLRANATIRSGDLTLARGTATTISGPNGSIVLDAAGNMTVSGIVYVEGSITFNRSGPIIYQGSGTLVTTQSAYVHCDLLPKTNFPHNDVLGLIAKDKVELATGAGDAQLTMAIAMYAQHRIISSKQNQVAGTMVASYYSMTQVPRLYQVPDLANHLPPGLPGGDPVWIIGITVESWQEI